MQAAAHEARLGHIAIAQQLRELIDESKRRASAVQARPGQLVVLEPRGELASLLSVQTPSIRFSDMALPEALAERLKRVLLEQRQQKRLREHSLSPRRKLLFLGPPGSGKTMTASALAGELHLPLFTIMLEGLITKFMGETAAKLRLVFEAIRQTQGVYLFDEFDALGAHRSQSNDVGEIRRVLNSFLQLLEKDSSQSLIVAATNTPKDAGPRRSFRRFDDVIEYILPDAKLAEEILAAQAGDVPDWRTSTGPGITARNRGIEPGRAGSSQRRGRQEGCSGRIDADHVRSSGRGGSRTKGSLPLNAGTAAQSPAPLFARKRLESGAVYNKGCGQRGLGHAAPAGARLCTPKR